MEKWSLDGVEGQVKRYVVDEEVFIIEDEFVNSNGCNKCKTSEERIKELEAALEKEKQDHVMMKQEYSKFIDSSEKSYAELNKKYKGLVTDIQTIVIPKLQRNNSYIRDEILPKLQQY